METCDKITIHKCPNLLDVVQKNRIKDTKSFYNILNKNSYEIGIREFNLISNELQGIDPKNYCLENDICFENEFLNSSKKARKAGAKSCFFLKLNIKYNPLLIIYLRHNLKLSIGIKKFSKTLINYQNGIPQELFNNTIEQLSTNFSNDLTQTYSKSALTKIKRHNEKLLKLFHDPKCHQRPPLIDILENLKDYVFQCDKIDQEIIDFTIYVQVVLENVISQNDTKKAILKYKLILDEKKHIAMIRELNNYLTNNRVRDLISNKISSKQLSQEIGISPQRIRQIKDKTYENLHIIFRQYFEDEIEKLLEIAKSKNNKLNIDELRNNPNLKFLFSNLDSVNLNLLDVAINSHNLINKQNKITYIS